MGEPVSAAASFIGIIAVGLHGARRLLNDLENIGEAPKAIAGLKEDLRGVEMAIEGLKAVEPSELESLGVAEQSLSAIKTCDKACETFRNDLQRWTKHSEDGKLSKRDRVKVGYFGNEKIKSLSTQFQNCKMTLISAVSIATLNSSIRQSDVTTEIRKQLTKSEIELAAAIKSRDIQITEVEKRLEDVSLADPSQQGDEASEKAGAVQQIEEEEKALRESRELLQVLLAKSKDQSGISVTNIRMSDKGQVVAGLVNAKGKHANARVVIDNVEVTSGGKAIIGIAEDLSLDNFF